MRDASRGLRGQRHRARGGGRRKKEWLQTLEMMTADGERLNFSRSRRFSSLSQGSSFLLANVRWSGDQTSSLTPAPSLSDPFPLCAPMSPSTSRRSSSFFRARHRSFPYQRDDVRFCRFIFKHFLSLKSQSLYFCSQILHIHFTCFFVSSPSETVALTRRRHCFFRLLCHASHVASPTSSSPSASSPRPAAVVCPLRTPAAYRTTGVI